MIVDQAVSYIAYLASGMLVGIGAYGLTATRNLLRMLLSIEVIFNGVLLAIIAYLSFSALVGTLASILIVSVVSGEVIVVMAVLVAYYRSARTFDSTSLEEEGV